MQEEMIQITREKHASDPVRYSESRAAAMPDVVLSKSAARLPAAFADILEYPDKRWTENINALTSSVLKDADVVGPFSEFYLKTRDMSLIQLQELYAQTFDLNPNCALEIGYHLFGEDYKRGAFLANLRETENPFDLGQEEQLPDYLPVLLRLLVHLNDDDLRGSLAAYCLIPGLEKIITAFKDENPYLGLIRSVRAALGQAISEDQCFEGTLG